MEPRLTYDKSRRTIVATSPAWVCAARKQGSAGGNEPADCNWPVCGCDPKAQEVIDALAEAGLLDGREKVAAWMIERGYATGHGDTLESLLSELVSQTRPLKKKPVAFRVKGYADDWIIFQDEEDAHEQAAQTGASVQGLYVRDGT